MRLDLKLLSAFGLEEFKRMMLGSVKIQLPNQATLNKPVPLYVSLLMAVFVLGCCMMFHTCDKSDVRLPLYEEEQLKLTRLKLSEAKSRHFDVNMGKPLLIPSDEVLYRLNENQLLRLYWRYITTIQTLCRNQSRFGSLMNGGKEVCLDNSYIPSRPCIIYSFGSNFQFDFEVAARRRLRCLVYTYDPTMNLAGKTLPDEITFFPIGISGKDYVTKENWQMKTLQTIMKDNGHNRKVIDIVKMDIKGSEWEAITSMINSGMYRQVKQLLVEVHAGYVFGDRRFPLWGGVDLVYQLATLRRLYENGFRIFMREINRVNMLKLDDGPQLEHFTPINEISLINVAFSTDHL